MTRREIKQQQKLITSIKLGVISAVPKVKKILNTTSFKERNAFPEAQNQRKEVPFKLKMFAIHPAYNPNLYRDFVLAERNDYGSKI